MKTRNHKDAELLTAARIVAKNCNVSMAFVLASQTPQQIKMRCRSINRKREKDMDAIRSEW